jgi:hypothetical protein
LFRLILDNHPQVTCPGEFDFIFDLMFDEGRYPDRDQFVRWLATHRIFLDHHLNINADLYYPELVK